MWSWSQWFLTWTKTVLDEKISAQSEVPNFIKYFTGEARDQTDGRDFQLKLILRTLHKEYIQKVQKQWTVDRRYEVPSHLHINPYWSNDQLHLIVLSIAPGPVLSSNWPIIILQSFPYAPASWLSFYGS
jgi:hypothetical protein